MIVQQPLQVCMRRMIPVHLLLEERYWVIVCFLWGNIIEYLLTAELAFRTSLIAAVKFLKMDPQLKYVCLFSFVC